MSKRCHGSRYWLIMVYPTGPRLPFLDLSSFSCPLSPTHNITPGLTPRVSWTAKRGRTCVKLHFSHASTLSCTAFSYSQKKYYFPPNRDTQLHLGTESRCTFGPVFCITQCSHQTLTLALVLILTLILSSCAIFLLLCKHEPIP